MTQHPSIHNSQELVIGIVAPIGTDLDAVCTAIGESLKQVNYSTSIIRLSTLLDNLKPPKEGDWPERVPSPVYERYRTYMDAGNAFRKIMKRGDALALLSIGAIRDARKARENLPRDECNRHAYILKSLKHPEEVRKLRQIYGPAFAVFSACSPPAKRVQLLSEKIADSEHTFQTRTVLPKAQQLVLRDESESGDAYGQNVRKAFPMGDFFVNARSPSQLRSSTERIVELLFGNLFHTPNRDEYAMFHAQAAALRSASLQRQVGAVIATDEGDIISVGANEVPKPGGGLYWSGDTPDHRDFTLGYESNDVLKRKMLADIINRLKSSQCLSEEFKAMDVSDIVTSLGVKGVIGDAQIMNVLEFGRCVHAEMAAIVDAARRGAAVHGSTIYSTTFPCHECARHIVAAGIKRVVYVEPYPKSLVNELYPDSIEVDAAEVHDSHVNFEPFVGVAPRRYLDLFSLGDMERKDKTGRIRSWDRSLATPRLGEYSFRTGMINAAVEIQEFDAFATELSELGFVEDTRDAASGDRVVAAPPANAPEA